MRSALGRFLDDERKAGVPKTAGSPDQDLLEKLGRREEARAAFLRAAESASNDRERALLQARAHGPTAAP